MEVQLVNRVGQPEPDTSVFESGTTSGTDNDQRADGTANGGNMQDLGMVTSSKRGVSGDDGLHGSSDKRNDIHDNFVFLWRLRKYLLLLAVLAVSVTYNAGLSPPGGFWTDNSPSHRAGDPLLPVRFFERYEVFFYCNATAFAASLVLIILLLSKEVTSQRVWLRSMQATMILDLFSLMGAYAAGSCRALRSSIYILVLVFAVFLYFGIHILVFIRVVPKWLKKKVQTILNQILEKVQTMLNQMLSNRGVSEGQSSRHQDEEGKIEEARKFILMLATFAATITYQAGLSPPGGFWAENSYGYRPATFVLRRHYLLRFNIFICCNATSFVASLVTIILLLSTKLSLHGIRTQALFVWVIADLLGLIGAYAAGCCRDVKASFSVMFITVLVLICILVLVVCFLYKPVAMWLEEMRPRIGKLVVRLLSFGWDGNQTPKMNQENSQPTNQQVVQDSMSDAQDHSACSQHVSNEEAKSASSDDMNSTEDRIPKSSDNQKVVTTVVASSSDSLSTEEDDISNMEEQSVDNQQAEIAMGQSSSSDSLKSIQCVPPVGSLLEQNVASDDRRIATDNVKIAETSEMQPMSANTQRDGAEQPAQPMCNRSDDADYLVVPEADEKATAFGSRNSNNDQRPRHKNRNDYSDSNPIDVRLKKSRTYLLLLAILAVSLTYQAGLNPPGGFWTRKGVDHSAGDPILEDNYHRRYRAFFYFNATAFAASFAMIIMLLNKEISKRTIERRTLQITMVADLLALMGAFVTGSWREKMKSIYISAVIFLVIAYVPFHVWVSRHLIPEKYKKCPKLKQFLSWCRVCEDNHLGDTKKDLERRRSLLLILAILAATVTYQAGLNPPGGIWPDDNNSGGKPGNPVLRDTHPKRFDVFYYSNAVSFVSSVAIIILLMNWESCERGIKSYALRVCLVVGLLSLLVAYSAGSSRKVKPTIYLIIIAAAVLLCLVIQVLVLSSTHDALAGSCFRKFRIWFWENLLHNEVTPDVSDNAMESVHPIDGKEERKRHKYLMLLAILVASITYQAGLNPPGGFWSDDNSDGHLAGNPVLKDINPQRYMMFFICNAISFMSSIVVIMLLLSKSVRNQKVPLQALHFIMMLDLLALIMSYAAGSCRKVRTSIYVFVVVCGVVMYLIVATLLSSGIAKWLNEKDIWPLLFGRCHRHVSSANALTPERQV